MTEETKALDARIRKCMARHKISDDDLRTHRFCMALENLSHAASVAASALAESTEAMRRSIEDIRKSRAPNEEPQQK